MPLGFFVKSTSSPHPQGSRDPGEATVLSASRLAARHYGRALLMLTFTYTQRADYASTRI
jgi:hypothetical protein